MLARKKFVPRNLPDDLANELGAPGKVALSARDLGLGIPSGELVIALVGAVGKTYREPLPSTSILQAKNNPPLSVVVAAVQTSNRIGGKKTIIERGRRTGLLDGHCCWC
jgi:hypothetical protein